MSSPVDWAAVAASVQKNFGLGSLPAGMGGGPNSGLGTAARQGFNESNSSGYVPGYAPGSPDYNTGVQLAGPLTLPSADSGITAASEFTWALNTTQGIDEAGVGYAHHEAVRMTLAGGLAWLRDLSVHNKDEYNTVVGELVQAGYLTVANARLNRYTTEVGNAFVRSAVDVIGTNNDASGGGGVTTWQDSIDQIIAGRKSMGQLNADGSPASGSGSSGAQAPVEQDTFTDPATVRHFVDQAARSVLGRKLSDSEAATFAAAYHGSESAWNKQKFNSDTAQFNGQASSYTDHPDTSVAAEQYVNNSQALAPERTQQLVGSYIGVLRNMFGLGSGGVSSAVQ
jgi:hypothetical protein